MAFEIDGDVPYTAFEYGDGTSEEAVALVAGFAKEINIVDVEQAAIDLAGSGHDVVAYAYHPRVLRAGDAELLPEFIDTLSTDFLRRTENHAKRRFGGVSLGGAIAVGMQKKYESLATPERGLYAATGVDAAELIMRNQLFRTLVLATHQVDIRRAYEKNGYTVNDLKERWHDVQEPPLTPFTIALGGLDYIVRQREIMPTIAAWQKENLGIRVIRKPWLGHNGTIKWFNHNIETMLGPDPVTDGTDDTGTIAIAPAA